MIANLIFLEYLFQKLEDDVWEWVFQRYLKETGVNWCVDKNHNNWKFPHDKELCQPWHWIVDTCWKKDTFLET